MAETLDWSKLPTELEWLAKPAERYGRLQFEDRIYDFLRQVSSAEKSDLKHLGQQWEAAWPSIDAWLNAHPMTAHIEARLVYFTGVFLGTGADAGLL